MLYDDVPWQRNHRLLYRNGSRLSARTSAAYQTFLSCALLIASHLHSGVNRPSYIVHRILSDIRSFVLYQRIPFDRSFYTKMRDWRYFLILYIASSPNVLIVCAFFTVCEHYVTARHIPSKAGGWVQNASVCVRRPGKCYG